ncbi:MAG: hypothetical protein ACI8PZ_002320 [Myxococcota bacterium]|jgi:hypothetical protein
MRHPAVRTLALILLVACGGKESGESGTAPAAPVQTGLGVQLRHLDGSPLTGARVRISDSAGEGTSADPDAAGMTVFKDLPLGTTQVEVITDGFTTQHAIVDVVDGRMGGVQFNLKETSSTSVDPATPTVITDGTLTVTLPVGSVIPAATTTGTATTTGGLVPLTYAILKPEESTAIPGNLERFVPEVGPESIDVLSAFQIRKPIGVEFTGPAEVRVSTPPDSPFREPTLYLYTFAPDTGYWRRGQALVLEGDEKWAEMGNLGWWAIGKPAESTACLNGRVIDDDGEPLAGAELLAIQDDAIGVLRTNADENGEFCLGVKPGPQGQYYVFGWSKTLEVVYKDAPFFLAPEGPATCLSGGCLRLGDVRPNGYTDRDGDGYYEDVGDCDDDNPDVNPSPAFGDESFCFED